MKELIKLIIPDKIEFLIYILISLFILLIINIKKFWSYLGGTDLEQLKYSELVNPNVQNFIYKLDNDIVPRIADFMVWMFIGITLFLVITIIKAMIDSAKDQVSLAEYINKPKNDREIYDKLTRIAIRIFSILLFIFWLYYSIAIFLPEFSKLFFTSLLSLNNVSSWLWLAISTLLWAICLYIFAIICRLFALKIRVFS